MNVCSRLAILALLLAPAFASAEPTETEIANVTAEVVELRTSGGVTRLAIRYINGGAKEGGEQDASRSARSCSSTSSRRRSTSPIKDANGQFVGGPIGDSIDGGRILVTLPPGQPGVLWAYFDALPAGTVVSVEVPQMFPFEDVVVTEGAGTLLSAKEAKSTPAMRGGHAGRGQTR